MKQFALHLTSIILLLATLAGMVEADGSQVQISKGELEGANFAIARPQNWNGQLLIFAHGYRPESSALSADMDTTAPLYSQLRRS